MMHEVTLHHFAIQKNERVYQFIIQPGISFEELEAAIEEFKVEFAAKKEALLKQNEIQAQEAPKEE